MLLAGVSESPSETLSVESLVRGCLINLKYSLYFTYLYFREPHVYVNTVRAQLNVSLGSTVYCCVLFERLM